MSRADKPDPLSVFRRASDSMRAFGYLDRAWVETAYLAFLDRQQKKNDKARKRGGIFSFIGRLLVSIIPGLVPRDIPPSERRPLGRDPSSLKLLKEVLAHVPESGRRRRGGPGHHARPLDVLVANANKDDAELVAKFLRRSGLEEAGFPVRLIGGEGERPETGRLAVSVPETGARGAVLSALTGGLLYRFAYHDASGLNWEDTGKIFRSSGLYRIYVIPSEQTYFERRLLLVRLEEGGAVVRAAEIRRLREGYGVRGGYVVPASGVNTFILSSDFSTDAVAGIVEDMLGPGERDALFPRESEAKADGSAFLQEHQLGFYTLLNRGGGEVRGSLLDGPAPSGVVGSRLDEKDGMQIDALRLGYLTLDDIEDPRERMMILSLGSSPAVSIELG